jgi:purine-binding chemotaxis protein CheW
MPEDLNDAPSYGTVVDSRFISKIGKHKKEFIPILDLETVLDIEELSTRNDIKGK